MSRAKSIHQAVPGMWRFFARFWPHIRVERALIAGGLAALVGQTLMRLLEPWPLKFVIDEIIQSDDTTRSSFPIVGALDTSAVLLICALGLIAVTALRSTLSYRSRVNFAMAGNRVLTRIRATVFKHLQLLPLDYHYRERGGDLITRLVGDVGMIKEVTVSAVMPLLASVLVLAGMLTVMLWLNAQLALIVLIMLPLLWFLAARRSGKISQVARKNRKREGAMAATAAESLTAIKTVQTLAVDERFVKQFTSHNDASLKQGAKVARMTAGLERSVDLLIAVGSAFALWFGARQVINLTLTPGELLVFLFYLKRGFRPMRDYAKYSARLGKASAAAERVTEILDQMPVAATESDSPDAPRFAGEIHFDKVSFCYPDGSVGLQDVDLHIRAGETAMIIGPSGGGKSTLLNLLLRLHEPQSGRILVDGTDISSYSKDSYRSQFNVVLQDGLLFTASARENIALMEPNASDADVIAAARTANAHEFIRRLPNGYDTQIGERGVSLSQGQRQRIAIARAAIRSSRIFVLDEPTTGLDSANETAVTESIEKLSEGVTTLLVTHNPSSALSVDRTFIVQHGSVQELQGALTLTAGDAS